jgi:hypothetical protein
MGISGRKRRKSRKSTLNKPKVPKKVNISTIVGE